MTQNPTNDPFAPSQEYHEGFKAGMYAAEERGRGLPWEKARHDTFAWLLAEAREIADRCYESVSAEVYMGDPFPWWPDSLGPDTPGNALLRAYLDRARSGDSAPDG